MLSNSEATFNLENINLLSNLNIKSQNRTAYKKGVLDLATQKGFYPYEYTSDFETFQEELLEKEKFYSSLPYKKS